MHVETSRKLDEDGQHERDKVFVKLGQEDEDFRRKILDLHRKLSDVDEDSANFVANEKQTNSAVTSPSKIKKSTAVPGTSPESTKKISSGDTKEAKSLARRADATKELESIARRNERMSSSGDSSLDKELEPDASRKYVTERRPSTEKRRLRKLDLELERRRHLEQLRRKSERLEEVAEEGSDEGGPRETSILTRLRIRRRSIKLLGFLSGKSADRSQEERAARLLKMYMPEKGGAGNKAQNTITIHHTTSRDRRFWKLRSRRKSNSA